MGAPLRSFAVAIAAVAVTGALAEDYPSRPVRLIVPYLPGGTVDFVGRTVGQKLAETWNQSVIVDNRPGGGTNIGAELAAHAAPDGYTLFVGSIANAVNATLYTRLPFDLVKDFAPVSLMTIAPLILGLNPGVPAKTVKELIALAKAKPGALTYASAGIASPNHLAGAQFTRMAGVDIVHVPYKGGGAVTTDLIAGQVSMYFAAMPTLLAHVKSGRIRAIAVTSAKRSQVVPDLPTIAESGLPGYDQSAWHGLLAPARTPRSIIAKLHAEVVRALASPAVREKLLTESMDIVASSPEQFAAFIKADIAKHAELIKSAGIRIE